MQKKSSSNFWYAAIAGLCCIFIGLGLCRFAYTPLVPALIHHGWLSQVSASYLGTINFAGYLIGALFSSRLGKFFGIPALIKYSLVISILSLAFCALNWGFAWLSIWRFIAGLTGAFLVVLTPGFVVKKIPIVYRSRAGGVIFTGLGVGVIVSGLVLPAFATHSLVAAWLGAAAFALLATVVSWSTFSNHTNEEANTISNPYSTALMDIPELKSFLNRHLLLLGLGYGLFAIGLVPHSLFLVDYVHLQLGFNLFVCGLFWTLFGIGAVIGPFLGGYIADQIGTYKSLVGAYVISAIAVAMVTFNQITILYLISSFIVGAMLPTVVSLTSTRIVRISGTERHASLWGKMTLIYALFQAVGAYFMSLLMHKGFGYTTCFVIGAIAISLGLLATIFKKIPNKVLQETGAE